MEAAKLENDLSVEQKPLIGNYMFEKFEIEANTILNMRNFSKKRQYFIIMQKIKHKRKRKRKK